MPEKTIPSTPREVAAAVLDAITAQPEAFDMGGWVSLWPGQELAPDAPICGTTMCVAGWAAHLTGWKLVHSRDGVDVGGEDPAHVYAEKGDERRYIESVAQTALGLHGDGIFFGRADEALYELERLAGR